MADMILSDLQKTFDKTEYDVLLQKLYAIGFSKHTFNCYLSNRSFLVHLENSFSQPAFISRGVPHGSILELILFLIISFSMPMVQVLLVNIKILMKLKNSQM